MSLWNQAKEKKLSYARRKPESTELYRLAYHYHEELEYVWEEKFQQHYGGFRHIVKETLEKYLSCGILAHGAAKACCPDCNHSHLIAFSCKCRGFCPSCGTKRALIFAETLHSSILKPVPHKHCVFSIPKRLRTYFRYNRKLHKILFNAAWQSISEMYSGILPDATPAAILTLQTAGDALNHNPHLHGIIADGVFFPDNSFQQLSLSTDKLQKLFCHRVLKALLEEELITEHIIEQILSWNHSGFNVWFGDTLHADENNARLFVSSYIDRNPVENDKIVITEEKITYKHDSSHLGEAVFDHLEFLATLSAHIPNKYEQTIRYYGYYSARTRGKRRKLAKGDETIVLDDTDKPKKISKSWAALIKKIYEVEPLVCSKCGGKLKIIAFITETIELKSIMQNLNLPDFHPPPKVNTSPQNYDTQYTDILHAA